MNFPDVRIHLFQLRQNRIVPDVMLQAPVIDKVANTQIECKLINSARGYPFPGVPHYWIRGRYGWTACYIKEVNQMEQTLRFYQEIYNDKGKLVEIHEKYPDDKGHKKVIEEEP